MVWPNRYSSLWHMIAAPVVWAVHFCAVYGGTALVCARMDAPGLARIGIAAASVVALGLIWWIGRRAWRQWDYASRANRTHGGPRAEDRREFLGHSAWLLAIVSAIGVIFVSLPALFIESCL
ncbi:hypothetical protein MLD63_08555 [Paracoccus sp. TK19116]|uniref:Uncharacterized protein n=1 Tax=Paracoccus albicereus TaxID=2922394 RepID=A0ABT1MUD7_9RHOB|nr:hypothetical protein [Paracoccus albicereus]MCQ0970471.1 hypothetical protein [Paracoccus albicereus]